MVHKQAWSIKNYRMFETYQAALNFEEAEAWEDEMLMRCETLPVRTTKWHDVEILEQWGVADDFNYFCEVTGLRGFAEHPASTYEELSRDFLSTFKFTYQKYQTGKKGIMIPPSFDIKFMMQVKRIVMTLEKFCKAFHLPYAGGWEEIPKSSDEELAEFWASISVKIPSHLHRAKLNHIQHPALRIFAAFLARGFLARDNSSACTAPILHLLRYAKEGVAPTYNLGVMLARTLSYFVAHNYNDTPLTCGGIPTLVYDYIKVDMNLNSYLGTKVDKVSTLTLDVLKI
jgi:hypothetical protein